MTVMSTINKSSSMDMDDDQREDLSYGGGAESPDVETVEANKKPTKVLIREAFDVFVTCCNVINLAMFHAFFMPQTPFCTAWRQLAFDTLCMERNAPTTCTYTAFLWVVTIETGVNFASAQEGRFFGNSWQAFHGWVTILAWIEMMPPGEHPRLLLNLRVVDLIRVAKMMGIAHGLSVVLKTVVASMRAVIPVMVLVSLFLAFAATLGLHLFMGTFQQNCFKETDHGDYLWLPAKVNHPIVNRTCGFGYQCPPDYSCLVHGISDNPNNTIIYANPKYGFASYNSISDAVLQLLTSMSSASWWFQASTTIDSVGWTTSFIYWVLIIGVGTVFMLQLFLAAVKYEFKEAVDALEAKKEKHAHEKSLRQWFAEKAGRRLKEQRLMTGFRAWSSQFDSLSASRHGNSRYTGDTEGEAEEVAGNEALSDEEKKKIAEEKMKFGVDKIRLEKKKKALDAEVQAWLNSLRRSRAPTNAEEIRDQRYARQLMARVDALPTTVKELREQETLWYRVKTLAQTEKFKRTMLAVVFFNSITLSLYHVNYESRSIYGDKGPPPGRSSVYITRAVNMSNRYRHALNGVDTIWTAIYFVELVLNLLAMGVAKYFTTPSTLLDAFLVTISVLEFIPMVVKAVFSHSTSNALRALRILRIFRVRRHWESLDALLTSFEKALPRLVATLVTIVTFIYIFGTLGMYMFGTGRNAVPNHSHHNFRTFFNSELNVLQVLIGVNWPDIMVLVLHHGDIGGRGVGFRLVTYCYFLIVVLVGNYILFNGYIAQLLIYLKFGNPAEEFRRVLNAIHGYVVHLRRRCRGKRVKTQKASMVQGQIEMRELESIQNRLFSESSGGRNTSASILRTIASEMDMALSRSISMESAPSLARAPGRDKLDEFLDDQGEVHHSRSDMDMEGGSSVPLSSRYIFMRPSKAIARYDRELKKQAMLDQLHRQTRAHEYLPKGRSFGIFSRENPIRVRLAQVLASPYTDSFILAAIVASCILLVYQSSPGKETERKKERVYSADVVFTIIFVIEMLSKMVAFDFLGYFRVPWNVLDFVVVSSSALGLVFNAHKLKALVAVRVLRVLRPLRAIRQLPGLRVAIDSLRTCFPAFVNIMFVAILCYYVFAIIMLHRYAGKFWSCNDTTVANWRECYGHSQKVGLRRWENMPMNFDNIGQAMLTSFQVATRSRYYDPMWGALDAPGRLGEQPKVNQNRSGAIAFVIYILTASYLVMTLFIGAICNQFNERRKKQEGAILLKQKGSNFLTDEQGEFLRVVRMILYLRPPMRYPPPQSKSSPVLWPASRTPLWDRYVRWPCYYICSRRDRHGVYIFDHFVGVVIFSNACVMASYHFRYGNEAEFWIKPRYFETTSLATNTRDLYRADVVFTCFFIFEAVVKIISHGSLRQYLHFAVNKFDAVIVCVGTVELFLLRRHTSFVRVILAVEMARLLRLCKLVLTIPSVKFLVNVLVVTLPEAANLVVLLVVFVFMFSVIAMQEFGDMRTDRNYKFGTYTDVWNYKTFNSAFLTNLRWAFNGGQSDWAAFMHDVMDRNPAAWIYFVIFILLIPNLLMNLIIAVVLEEFAAVRRLHDSKESGSELTGLGARSMEAFAKTWAEMDPEAKTWIEVKDVPRFFLNLKEAAPELRIKSVYDIISVTKLKAPIPKDIKVKHTLQKVSENADEQEPYSRMGEAQMESNPTNEEQRRCSFVDIFIATSWYSFHVVERAHKTAAQAVCVWLQIRDEKKVASDLAADETAESAVLRRPSRSSEEMGLELVCSMGILKDGSADGDCITVRETASGQPLTYAMLEVNSAKDRLILAIDSHMATASVGKKVKPGTEMRTVEISASGNPIWGRTKVVSSQETFTKAAVVLRGMVRLHVAVDVKKDMVHVRNIMDDAMLLSMGRTLKRAFGVKDCEADTIDGEIIRDKNCAASIIALEVRTWLERKKRQRATAEGLQAPAESNVV